MIAKIGKDSQSIKDISKIKAPPKQDGAFTLYIIWSIIPTQCLCMPMLMKNLLQIHLIANV
jgi:hypothetical protein